MKKNIILLITLIVMQSCIPIRIAPNMDNYKVTKGEKFKRDFPKREMFVFEDPKNSNHFYNYNDTKFQLNTKKGYDDVTFTLNGVQYFFSFYEVEIPIKFVNLGGIVADAMLYDAGIGPIFGDS